MPSAHSRVGLVVDKPVRAVLDLYQGRSLGNVPDATAARKVVLEGGLVETAVRAAAVAGPHQQQALTVIEGLLGLIPLLDDDTQEEVRRLLAESRRPTIAQRRARQFALIDAAQAPVGGQTAADLADSLDAFDGAFSAW